MILKYADLIRELSRAANKKKATFLAGYFQTGKGQYAEGDRFIGLTVPFQRRVAKKYSHLGWNELEKLMKSPVHEHRFTCTEILRWKFIDSLRSSSRLPTEDCRKQREQIVKWYLTHTKQMNNWDLVDNTAFSILGEYCLEKGNHAVLYRLARSSSLWERRISIVATQAFIRSEIFDDTFEIVKILLGDKHDLIHKACGWMLREVGKRSPQGERQLRMFLNSHASEMPRTMLRYSIEKFSPTQRAKYLAK